MSTTSVYDVMLRTAKLLTCNVVKFSIVDHITVDMLLVGMMG